MEKKKKTTPKKHLIVAKDNAQAVNMIHSLPLRSQNILQKSLLGMYAINEMISSLPALQRNRCSWGCYGIPSGTPWRLDLPIHPNFLLISYRLSEEQRKKEINLIHLDNISINNMLKATWTIELSIFQYFKSISTTLAKIKNDLRL